MKVRILQGLAGAVDSYNAGDVADFSDDVAQRLIDAGIAIAEVEEGKRERTTKTVTSRAVKE
ncbi:hypothetical protein UFOVP942_26 [uncultured Caudovirales phage]|jgi:hypothetical protein|uniref:Uncharacterized protein n=1 Tax=uncultured Caudovirales phage TaxID=2100421 RepID=A0A6J5RXB4_9CAUD|nr:hypothetical protein UFOVP942_26 [uncultured Caudovirales phage]CAB4203260.1 hypothetical protein UFOVP1379_11 [uncultured Caudovirales phage]